MAEIEDDVTTTENQTEGPVSGSGASLEEDKKGVNPLLPLARVKKIIKSDPDVNMVGGDSCLMIAKSTEFFLAHLVELSYIHAQKEKRKTLQYKDVANAVNANDNLFFLTDVIPPQKTGKQISALLKSKQNRNSAPTGIPTSSSTLSQTSLQDDSSHSTTLQSDNEEEIDI